jgi:hypothetical protein
MAGENIALITGAGAIENAWNPIIRALQTLYTSDFQLNINGANSALADIVYLSKYFGSDNDKLRELYNDIKLKISANLIQSELSGEIVARAELIQIINDYIVAQNNNLLHITTNWDSTIENAINDAKYPDSFKFSERITGIYLHGKASVPESLYLPSEVSKETYRDEKQIDQYQNLHAHAGVLLMDCHRAIIYGLSLDPLDAELLNTISVGLVGSSVLKEIIIVNPEFDIVYQRLRAHFVGVKPPKITHWLM